MTDSFEHDLRQEPERLELEVFDIGGARLWPCLVFSAPEGFRPLSMDLAVPEGPGPHPLVVYVHGGGFLIGTPKYDNPTLRAVRMRPRLLEAGYAVARISYRLAGEAHWPAQLHDCQAAVRYLRTKAGVFGLDAGRFAVLGESAGGHLACMTALAGEGETAVQAAVNWYGVTDFTALEEDAESPIPRLMGMNRSEAPEAWRDASPVHNVRPGAPPFLHQHGDRDRVVALSQAEALHDALTRAGVPSTLEVIDGADHCFWGAATPRVMDGVIAFLKGRL